MRVNKVGRLILIAIAGIVLLVSGTLLIGSYFLVRSMRSVMAEVEAPTPVSSIVVSSKSERKKQPISDLSRPSRSAPLNPSSTNVEEVADRQTRSHLRATKIAGRLAELTYSRQLAQSEHFEPCRAICGTPEFKMKKGEYGVEPIEQFLEAHGEEAFRDPRFSSYILKMNFIMGDLFPVELLTAFLKVEENKGSDISTATKFLPMAMNWLTEIKGKISRMRERSHILRNYGELAKDCREKTVSEEVATLQCQDLMAHLQ